MIVSELEPRLYNINLDVGAVYVDVQDTIVTAKGYLMSILATMFRYLLHPKELNTWLKAIKLGFNYKNGKKLPFRFRKKSLLDLCEGRSVEMVEYFGRVLTRHINNGVVKRLLKYQDAGRPIILISAEVYTGVRPLMNKLKETGIEFSGYVLNDLVLKDGKITNKLKPYSKGIDFHKVIDGPRTKFEAFYKAMGKYLKKPSKVECINDNDELEGIIDYFVRLNDGYIVKGNDL